VLLGGLFDMMDRIMARSRNQQTPFGAFLDSVLDRYADAFLFVGTAAYCVRAEELFGALLGMGCLAGVFATSYSRARAEGLGLECRIGILERAERILLLVLGLITGWLIPALWLIFILSNATATQRILYVRNRLIHETAERDMQGGRD